MLKKIIIAFFLIYLCYAIGSLSVAYHNVYLSHAEAEVQLNKQKEEQEKISKMTYVEMVDYIAPQFQQKPEELKLVIWNESGFKVKSHDGGRAKNITAIHNDTFNRWLPTYKKEVGEDLNIDSQFDQIKMMAFAFSKGTAYKDDWTTWVACQNTDKKYSFHSRLLEKDFTVVCKPLPKDLAMI